MAKIELVNVSHAYMPGKYAVQDINLSWADGTANALLGPSGCGKTTLLKIISGLLTPSEGQVLVDGKDVTHLSPRERNVAQVFQFPIVYGTLSVADNLAFPLRNRGFAKGEIKARVDEVAEILDLQNVLKKKAGRLGAGEKQLISMGRGIVRGDTAALLLDEPLTVIDPLQKWELRRKLKELHQRTQFTMIYVTHDQHEALTFAEQVTVMDVGRALQTGSPSDLHDKPKTPFVGYFIGSPGMNVLPAAVKDGRVMVGDYNLNLNFNENGKVKVGIRPEYVQMAGSDNNGSGLRCDVAAIMRTESAQIVTLKHDDVTLKARVGEHELVRVGDGVTIRFPAEHTLLYSDDHLVEGG